MKRVVFIILVLFSYESFAFCNGTPVVRGEKRDGTVVSLFVSYEKMEENPSWDPLSNQITPLSFREALDIFREWSASEIKGSEVTVNSIELNRYGCYKSENKWYFRVDYSLVENGEEVFDVGNWLVILFDGTVVEPVLSN